MDRYFKLDPLLYENSALPEIIGRICDTDPKTGERFDLYLETGRRLYQALTREQRNLLSAFESAHNHYVNHYIHAAYYAGLGVRSLFVEELGFSDESGSQPEPGSQPRS